LKTCFYA